MCGIVGYIEPPNQRPVEESRQRLERMRDSLRHRGPDDQGSWIDPAAAVALGHRRLSILDLSPEGHQPMASANGRYQLVYNGEVYNYRQLRQELEAHGHTFRGGSDTEVLLAAFCQWGPEATLPRLNGMFALALWDAHSRQLCLARDRYGKKPLYYGRVGQAWAFASELKALRTLSDFQAPIDRAVLALYLRFGYVPTPHTIYQDIHKLAAASFVWLTPQTAAVAHSYWSLQHTAEVPRDASQDQLEKALLQAVQLRMVSDVPLGAFLSGGIDSSLIVALMQEQSSQPVRTFSLGFAETSHDEAIYARQVAAHLGTQHTEHYVTPRQTLEVVPLLPALYDEPFADSSQIPTYLVSQLARGQVTVALSGDGGDEVFGGYNRYLYAPRIWRILARIPRPLRQLAARMLSRISMQTASGWVGNRVAYPQEKLTKLCELLAVSDARALYKSLVSQWKDPDSLVIGGHEPPTLIDSQPMSGDLVDWMMQLDALTYLADDILVKVDRASMGVSLEARAPLLDPQVTELAWRLPRECKIRHGQGKWVLRQMLYKRVPQRLFERPKAGFSLPMGAWLRGELRPWAEDMLAALPAQGYLRPEPIRQRWQQHLNGQRDWSSCLWAVLMFQAWLVF